MSFKNLSKLNFALILITICTLPFFTVINSACIIILVISLTAQLFILPREPLFFKRNYFSIAVLSCLFLMYLLSFIFLDRLENGFVIEKKISLLVFPLIFGSGIIKLTKKQFDWILLSFVCSVFMAATYTFSHDSSLFFRHDMAIAESIIIRRPYFGLYSLFSVFIIGYLLMEHAKKWIHIFAGLIPCMLFVYFSYLIYAKMALVSFVLTMACILSYILIRRFYNSKFYQAPLNVFFIVAGIFVVFFLYFKINFFFREFFWAQLSDQEYNINVSSSWEIRKMIWRCAYEILSKDFQWISGLGTQATDYLLNECYIKYYSQNTWFIDEHFNAHSEFLQTWLEVGLVGILILILNIYFSLRCAMKSANVLYLSFTLFFFFCCFTESFLSAQKGIVFYSFFNSYLFFSPGAIKTLL